MKTGSFRSFTLHYLRVLVVLYFQWQFGISTGVPRVGHHNIIIQYLDVVPTELRRCSSMPIRIGMNYTAVFVVLGGNLE